MLRTLIVDDGSFKPCNCHCSYCREKASMQVPGGFEDPIRGITRVQIYHQQHAKIMTFLAQNIECSIFKISGHGEITLIQDFWELLPSFAEKHVIITNASLLKKEILEKLVERNIVLSVSLDGHIPSLNMARGGNPEKVLSLLQLAAEQGIPVEINSVLTHWNIEQFDQFLEYLQGLEHRVMCIPFPVRDFSTQSNSTMKANLEQIQCFKTKVLDEYLSFKDVLPPLAYLKAMLDTMNQGRQISCYLPQLILPINWRFDLLKCPCGPTQTHGNLLTDPVQALTNWNIKNANNCTNHPFDMCTQCFTHYDLLNLYLQNLVTASELARIPSLNGNKVVSFLNTVC